MDKCKVIAVTNQKGGVGKTTLSLIHIFSNDLPKGLRNRWVKPRALVRAVP